MNRSSLHTLLPILILLLAACNGDDKTVVPASSTESSALKTTTSTLTDAWLGKWNGPEGTFIEISGGNGSYIITIQDLDGPKQYKGKNKDDQIIFDRNGITEIIEASNGADTGMKWLADKSNCLRVSLGEGWCRD
ncbi:MAG: hypothetical protein V4660_17665 [Pseudomonadota bacterium]